MASELLFKISWVVLVYLLLLGQYKMWLSQESVVSYLQLQNTIKNQTQQNISKRDLNQALYAEVDNLKLGLSALEERARTDLGLIREGEHYYQVID